MCLALNPHQLTPEQRSARTRDPALLTSAHSGPENRWMSSVVVGRHFGGGPSREHAVWRVAQAGFCAVVAPGKDVGFADILEGNAYNNALLPVELPVPEWERLA